MGTAHVPIKPFAAEFLSTLFPQRDRKNGTNFPVEVLWFDAATDEKAYWKLRATDYLSGNPSLELQWYADTATSGDIVWEAAIACITPDADTQDIETKAFATAQTVTDTHLGTTGQRLHKCTITITNLDGIAAGDYLALRISRLGSNGSDTMTGDAGLVLADLSYTT